MTFSRAIVSITLLGVGLVAGATLTASSPLATSNVKNLLRVPLADAFTPGREVLVDLVEISPNAVLDRHWHPGEEFHYYLEGDVEIKIDGEAPIIGTPGAVGHVPFQKRHVAVAGKQGAKVLVFRVHTKGEPWRYVDSKDAPDR